MNSPLARMVVGGRPSSDPACAGCGQLGIFRALRRAGLEARGGSGCDPDGAFPLAPQAGPWAAVTGTSPILSDARGIVAAASAAGARLLVLADRDGVRARRAARLLGRAAPTRIVGANPGGAEAAVREAILAPGTAIVALTACPRLARRAAPLAVLPARCNRCGACLSLGCPAISDVGGEAMVVDPALCSGCRLCTSLCRGGAIGARR